MKNFFIVLFGGLTIILVVSTLASFSSNIFNKTKSSQAVLSNIDLGRSIYTAQQEEDIIDTPEIPFAQMFSTSTKSTIGASAYLIKDITHNTILAGRNQDQLLPIASLAKLITAIVARQNIEADTRITIGPKVMSTYGNTAGFKDGEVFTAQDLYYPLLMVSSNDAAEALAMTYGRAKFIKLMNDFAQSIGAYHTYIADPAGLSPNTVSSAGDLALILSWITYNDPEIMNITKLKTKTIRSHTWVNPTHFLSWSYFAGGKNGYIPEANKTTAALFSFSTSTTYAIVALGSASRDKDIISLLEKVKK